jgi:hypothetical protein
LHLRLAPAIGQIGGAQQRRHHFEDGSRAAQFDGEPFRGRGRGRRGGGAEGVVGEEGATDGAEQRGDVGGVEEAGLDLVPEKSARESLGG